MGGIGSGEWKRNAAKITVDRSQQLAIHEFRRWIDRSWNCELVWLESNDWRGEIPFCIEWEDSEVVLKFLYPIRQGVYETQMVQLESTPAPFSGTRWWFLCPLSVGGGPCHRRVRKVYLPPGQRHFGCRECHHLTYRSCQRAHLARRELANFHKRSDQLMRNLERIRKRSR